MPATLLLIDDDDGFRSLVRRALERNGYAVLEAANGRDAVDVFGKSAVDLVITDLHMPVQEGVETISALRAGNERLPIIAMSGSSEASLEDAMLLGANFRLNKPFRLDDLLIAVAVLLGEDEEKGRGGTGA